MEEGRSAFKILTVKPTGKRDFGRPRFGWEDNIRMDIKATGANTRNKLVWAHDRDYWKIIVSAALNLQIP